MALPASNRVAQSSPGTCVGPEGGAALALGWGCASLKLSRGKLLCTGYVIVSQHRRWLTEFRNNQDDNFMVALFADRWLG